jgi:tetratricopeptide (TPR) repeat protein
MVAGDRGRPSEAGEWYRKALAIMQEAGDRPGLATTYHQLGVLAQRRDGLVEAEEWYRKALVVHDEVGDRPGLAMTYHQLGKVAKRRNESDEAEQWFRQALDIEEEVGDLPSMSSTCGELGLLAVDRGQLPDALAWTVRSCVALAGELPHPVAGPGPENLALLTGMLGMAALEGTWRRVTGDELPGGLRDYVRKQLGEAQ